MVADRLLHGRPALPGFVVHEDPVPGPLAEVFEEPRLRVPVGLPVTAIRPDGPPTRARVPLTPVAIPKTEVGIRAVRPLMGTRTAGGCRERRCCAPRLTAHTGTAPVAPHSGARNAARTGDGGPAARP